MVRPSLSILDPASAIFLAAPMTSDVFFSGPFPLGRKRQHHSLQPHSICNSSISVMEPACVFEECFPVRQTGMDREVWYMAEGQGNTWTEQRRHATPPPPPPGHVILISRGREHSINHLNSGAWPSVWRASQLSCSHCHVLALTEKPPLQFHCVSLFSPFNYSGFTGFIKRLGSKEAWLYVCWPGWSRWSESRTHATHPSFVWSVSAMDDGRKRERVKREREERNVERNVERNLEPQLS